MSTRGKKYDSVLVRMRSLAKERKLRVVLDCKDIPAGSMQIDGERVFVAPLDTFPSAEALAISFCHELAHDAMWRETKSRSCWCGFQEECWAWAIGIDYYYDVFKGLRLRRFDAYNFKLRRFVVSRLATFAGMFNIRCEGFVSDSGAAREYAVDRCGRMKAEKARGRRVTGKSDAAKVEVAP